MKVKIVNFHRKEMMNYLSNYIQKNKIVDNIIIAGDWNQDINAKEIQDFYIKHRLLMPIAISIILITDKEN